MEYLATMHRIAISLPILAVGLGFLSHWFYFIHGEHHMRAPLYGTLFLASFPCLYFSGLAIQAGIEIVASYLLALYTSMTIYRLFFHRLHTFPGPRGARISKIWHVWQVRHAKNHLLMEKLHRQYGTFVRTGPEELTIFSTQALWAINAPGSAFVRPDWYDMPLPLKSLANVRDVAEHDQRRRVWDQAFSAKALRNYEGRITKYADQLDQKIAEANGQPVNVYNAVSYYTSDMMSDLAFGKAFGNLQSQSFHHSVQGVRDFMSVFGTLTPVPWFVRLGSGILRQFNGWKRFFKFTADQMNARIMQEPPVPDVSSYLIAASVENGTLEEDLPYLEGDALVLLIVGSDSMATTLINCLACLARHPRYQEQLRAELQTLPSLSDFSAVLDLPILASIIKEALRLWPPIATGSSRITPKGGMTISGKYIPAGTKVYAPRYVIARMEECFERPDDFVPERWTVNKKMIKDRRGYSPFSHGRYNCVGQRLSMMNVSYVVALIVSKYDIALAPGEDGTRVYCDLQDNFTFNPGRLDLVFSLCKRD